VDVPAIPENPKTPEMIPTIKKTMAQTQPAISFNASNRPNQKNKRPSLNM